MGRQLYDYQDDVKFRDYFSFWDKRQRLNFRKIEYPDMSQRELILYNFGILLKTYLSLIVT